MSRRRSESATTGRLNVVDIKTGKFIETPCLPIICANIRNRRNELGLEQKELAARLGIHSNAVSSWEVGRTRPDISLIPSLCRELNLTPYDLFSMDDPRVLYTPREERLIGNYRKLDNKFKAHVDSMVASLAQTVASENAPDLYEIKFQPIRLAAGPDAAIRDITEAETLYLHNSPLLRHADGVYKVNGDSMEPSFHDGDMVLVEHIPDGNALRYGEIGAFAIGNESYIKEYQQDGLHSHNKNYDVMKFDKDAATVYLIGRVLGVVDPQQFATQEEIELYLQSKKNEE